MRGATAVIVRHKPQWYHHDRRGSAVIPSLIAVAPPKTVKTVDLRGGTACMYALRMYVCMCVRVVCVCACVLEYVRVLFQVVDISCMANARCHCGDCTT